MNLVAGEWIVGMEGEKRLEIVAVGDGVLPAFRRSTFTPNFVVRWSGPGEVYHICFPVCMLLSHFKPAGTDQFLY